MKFLSRPARVYLRLFALLASLPFAGQMARSQTVYTYNGASAATVNTSLWSNAANWNPNTGYPGSNGSTTTDTALLNDTAANRIVTYDVGATGYLGTFGVTQTSAFNNEVALTGSAFVLNGYDTLQVKNNFALAASTGGASTFFVDSFTGTGGGTSTSGGVPTQLEVGTTGTGTLTVSNGGVLEMLSGATSATAGVNPRVMGNVSITGGTLNSDRGVAPAGAGSSINTVTGTLTMSAGTINLAAANSLGQAVNATPQTDNRLSVTGNVQITGGTINQETGGTSNATSSILSLSTLYMTGTANYITGTTFTGGATLELNSGANQAFYSNDTLNNFAVRGGTTGTSAAPLTVAKTIGAANANGTALGTGTLNVGQIQFADGNAYNNSILTLGSNVTETPGALLPARTGGNLVLQEGINVAGHTLDLTAVSTALNNNNGVYAPVNTVTANGGSTASGSVTFTLNSSAAGGVIAAPGFDLSQGGATGGVIVTGNLTLQATGAATATNLGGSAAVVSNTLPATSTFLYTGAGTAAAPATVTSNRAIGALTVGNGTAASVLQLAAATLPVQANVTVNAASTLQLGGQILSMTSGANLTGTGTVAGVTGGTVSTGNGVTFTGTGGLSPGAATGAVGTLTLTGTQAVTLASTSVSTFDVAGPATPGNDHLTLGGTGTVTLNYNGTLSLNFTFTPANGAVLNLVDADAAVSGNFTSISSNLSGDTFTFDPASGNLTVIAAPEPGTWIGVAVSMAAIFAFARRGRQQGGCPP